MYLYKKGSNINNVETWTSMVERNNMSAACRAAMMIFAFGQQQQQRPGNNAFSFSSIIFLFCFGFQKTYLLFQGRLLTVPLQSLVGPIITHAQGPGSPVVVGITTTTAATAAATALVSSSSSSSWWCSRCRPVIDQKGTGGR
jgi:hypothetical protein